MKVIYYMVIKACVFLLFMTACTPEETGFRPGDSGNTGPGLSNPAIPDGFVEEPDDPSSDQSLTFDYSLLAKAGHPRLLIDNEGFAALKNKVTTDKYSNATLYRLHDMIVTKARKIVDKNVSFSSNSDQYVILENLLFCSYAYRMTGESGFLTKVTTDLRQACSLSSWNPSGLAVGEIAFAVAVAYDWLYYELSLEDRTMARKAMETKAVQPMYNKSYANTIGNWNSICLGGVACASMAIYEKSKSIAVKQIEKACAENLKGVTGMYKPHGNYGEGCGYWEYGGSFQVCFLTCLEDIFGHTAGIKDVQGFLDSGEYGAFMHGTMNTTFSYSDGGSTNDSPWLTSWWYAAELGDRSLIYCEKYHLDKGSYASKINGTSFRLLPAIVAMIRDFAIDAEPITPPVKDVWHGDGEMPVVIVRKGWNFDASDVYLGIKAGQCNSWKTSQTSHAHMDAGSFVFEAEGVRWSDDLMRPTYSPWFQAMKDGGSRSGDTSQKGLRWDTFRVSNLGHSTIVSYTNDGSVKDKIHSSDYYVDGFATIDKVIDAGGRQGGVVNMTGPMKGQVADAQRTIELVDGTTLVVTDRITALPSYDCILEWRMMSRAGATSGTEGITLTMSGKTRYMSVTSSNSSVKPEYRTWPTTKPTGDGWGVLDFYQEITGRTISGWTATVPAGKTVTFVTTLEK